MDMSKVIDSAKIVLSLDSDRKLAKFLGIPDTYIAGYRTDERAVDEYVLCRLADVIGKNPLLLLAEYKRDRTKNENRREYWGGIVKRIQKEGQSAAGPPGRGIRSARVYCFQNREQHRATGPSAQMLTRSAHERLKTAGMPAFSDH